MSSLSSIGYLSGEAESLRESICDAFSIELEQIREGLRIAFSELPSEEESFTSGEYLVGLGMWQRALEGCQATVLLMEYGFLSSQFSTLRTAYECLFVACGLWRDKVTLKQLENGHNFERLQQARLLHEELLKQEHTPEILNALSAIKNESVTATRFVVRNAAHSAGLGIHYENSYRGLSLVGAHATVRSLDSHDSSNTEFKKDLHNKRMVVLRETAKCLDIGMNRHREALEKYGYVIKRSVSYTPSDTPESMQTK